MKTKHLLQAALGRQQAIRELEAQLEEAKDYYRRAVREMHLSGMSLREIATVLKVSHQRIHQLVEEGNERAHSWLRPVNPDLRCSFCGLGAKQVNKLVAGPDMFICMCDTCAGKCSEVLKAGEPIKANKRGFRLLGKAERLRCSFCDKPRGNKRSVVAGKEHQVCAPCVEVSLRYMRENVSHPGW